MSIFWFKFNKPQVWMWIFNKIRNEKIINEKLKTHYLFWDNYDDTIIENENRLTSFSNKILLKYTEKKKDNLKNSDLVWVSENDSLTPVN